MKSLRGHQKENGLSLPAIRLRAENRHPNLGKTSINIRAWPLRRPLSVRMEPTFGAVGWPSRIHQSALNELAPLKAKSIQVNPLIMEFAITNHCGGENRHAGGSHAHTKETTANHTSVRRTEF
jgi:hypothetical protein